MAIKEIQFRVGHLWFDELAERYTFPVKDVIETSIPIDKDIAASQAPRSLCLKLALNRVAGYGILGVRFVPDTEQFTKVRVCVGNESDEDIGSPRDYAEAVAMQSEKLLVAQNTLGSGVLTFDRALHNHIDTSILTFKVLTTMLLEIMLVERESLTPEQLYERVIFLYNDRSRWKS